jgi:peptidoglycan/xylan/chitin deacetylase (PgdA/CDA1 family)
MTPRDRKRIAVLMFHNICDDLPPSDLVVSTENFREQMKYLKDTCDVISMRELIDIYHNPSADVNYAKTKAVITIDDGYLNNYTNALPVLKDLDLPATVFVTTVFTNTDMTMPRYQHLPGCRMLNWQELAEMRKQNITLCSHTHTHPHLPTLSYEQQKAEIQRGVDELYAHFPDPIIKEVFAYTYGEFDDITRKILRELNFKIGLTCWHAFNDAREDPLLLKRLTVDGRKSLAEFANQFSLLDTLFQALNEKLSLLDKAGKSLLNLNKKPKDQ